MILSDEEILAHWEQTYVQSGDTGIAFARAIEAAIVKRIGEPVGVIEHAPYTGIGCGDVMQLVKMYSVLDDGTPLFTMPKEQAK